jgi:hypothetical protein
MESYLLSTGTFDKSKNTQYDNILVEVSKDSVPESVGAMIYFTGKIIYI